MSEAATIVREWGVGGFLPAEEQPISRAETIAAVYRGFRRGLAADVQTVRGWIRSVLHGGNWRFADPEAVLQDTLVRLVDIAGADRVADESSFQKFVYSVAKNTCVDVYHRERRRSSHETAETEYDDPPDDNEPPGAAIQRRERRQALVYIAQRLPESCRELWVWVYGEGTRAADIAERLGISVANVRVRVHRCLEKARGIARDSGIAPGPGRDDREPARR